MPTADDLKRILEVASSRQELDYFFDQLTTPEWIPVLRQAGMFDAPPEPIRHDDMVSFPGWAASRYLVRVANKAPDAVVSVLLEIQRSSNPRVWADIVTALAEMPAPYGVPFIPRILAWIHSPYQVGVEDHATRLGHKIAAAEMRSEALGLLGGLAALVAPQDWPVGDLWAPLGDWDYKRLIPPLATNVVSLSRDAVTALADQFERAFEAREEGAADYSSIWRPAIENHEQNWGHDQRLNALVETIRDSALARTREHPTELRSTIEGLLARSAGILKRIGIYLLVERGELDLDLVGAVLTDKQLFRNTEFHHEFYRLARARFAGLPDEQKARYLELVDEVGRERGEGKTRDEAEQRSKWWAWNRLGAVAPYLTNAAKDRYETLLAERGPEDHPDFLSWHGSWSGPTSPLSKEELNGMTLDQLAEHLASWSPSQTFGPAPSREGLARELQAAAADDPVRYAPFAAHLMTLPPVYAGWYLLGMREALKADKSFDVAHVVRLCFAVVERSRAADVEPDLVSDDTWQSARIDAARFLEEALERRQLADDPDGLVWRTIAMLLDDPDPTPASEEQYGPPNQDALTYSLNSTRGQAIHAALAYAWWAWLRAARQEEWSLRSELPDTARLLEAHLPAERDPSLAIAAAFGWWLANLIAIDAGWVEAHAPDLLGDLTKKRERSAWDAYLMRASPGPRNLAALRRFYDRFARLLADAAVAPADRVAMTDPVARMLAHLVILELHGELPVEGGPLTIILDARRPWLLEALVEEAGQIAKNSGELDSAIDEAFRALWGRIRAAADGSGDTALRESLGKFSWWFASKLHEAWALPELVDLLESGVHVSPEFLVLPRLAELVAQDVERVLHVLEKMAPRTDNEWAFRAHEEQVREILRVSLASGDPIIRERARALVNRLGRLGMLGLGSLLPQTGSAPAE